MSPPSFLQRRLTSLICPGLIRESRDTADVPRNREQKAEKLSAKEEDGSGPYGSTATCAPSEFDVIGQGVLPELPVAKENMTPKRGEAKGENPESKAGEGRK